MQIKTHRFLALGATTAVGFVALGLALPDNTPQARLLLDPPDRTDRALVDPLRAMAPWKDFPVGENPRPLVVFDAVKLPPALRAAPALDTLVRGRWIAPDPLPPSPPALDAYPVLSAEAALATLRRTVLGTTKDPGPDADAEPVGITEMRLTRSTFDTDRGRLTLPAWTVRFGGEEVPATVLAVRGDGLYPTPVPTDAKGDVTLSPDGMRLTYSFFGAAPGEGNCRADYTPVFQETATAVAVGAIEHPNGHNNSGTCRLSSYRRSVWIQLTAPLANRVVVTYAYGSPLPVRPDGTYRWYRSSTRDR
ncbi:MAG TPA: hypothetical protein VMZ00_04045 [Sporichthya sp.]|nr:hypothetical protein [Sporichthya sp.]